MPPTLGPRNPLPIICEYNTTEKVGLAIITTSTIIFPLLPALGLDSEMGKVWAIMSLGVGSMTISHANDSYFWIVSQMSEMDVKTAYKTHTVGTFFQGALGFFLVLIGYLIWSSFK